MAELIVENASVAERFAEISDSASLWDRLTTMVSKGINFVAEPVGASNGSPGRALVVSAARGTAQCRVASWTPEALKVAAHFVFDRLAVSFDGYGYATYMTTVRTDEEDRAVAAVTPEGKVE
jgi:hypothetical protein